MQKEYSGVSARWADLAKRYLRSIQDPARGAARSTASGPATLYGTCYSLLAMHYLGEDAPVTPAVRHFVMTCQDSTSGLFVGPELVDFVPRPGAAHDLDHLLLHLTCAVL